MSPRKYNRLITEESKTMMIAKQLDASLLDASLCSLLVSKLRQSLIQINLLTPGSSNAELEFLYLCCSFFASTFQQLATPGMVMSGVAYAYNGDHKYRRSKNVMYFGLAILFPYLVRKAKRRVFELAEVDRQNNSTSATRSNNTMLTKIVTLEKITTTLEVCNFVHFLWSSAYPTLADRVGELSNVSTSTMFPPGSKTAQLLRSKEAKVQALRTTFLYRRLLCSVVLRLFNFLNPYNEAEMLQLPHTIFNKLSSLYKSKSATSSDTTSCDLCHEVIVTNLKYKTNCGGCACHYCYFCIRKMSTCLCGSRIVAVVRLV